MALRQRRRPFQAPNHPYAARQTERANLVQMPPPPPPHLFRARRLQDRDWSIRFWLQRTMDAFEQLILVAESQPSNGTVRKVYPPNSDTNFAFAYGGKPDNDLRDVLRSIHHKHGEVTLGHDGRDSTGKHWITCYSMVKPNTFERPILKAVICVFSKLEMATMPRPQPFLRTDKGKAIADWLDKVPDDVSDAPDNLFSMPWREQLPWLKPAAAKALHDTMLAEEWEWPGKTHGLRVGANRATTVKGMTWNPLLFRWEGNEEALAAFM